MNVWFAHIGERHAEHVSKGGHLHVRDAHIGERHPEHVSQGGRMHVRVGHIVRPGGPEAAAGSPGSSDDARKDRHWARFHCLLALGRHRRVAPAVTDGPRASGPQESEHFPGSNRRREGPPRLRYAAITMPPAHAFRTQTRFPSNTTPYCRIGSAPAACSSTVYRRSRIWAIAESSA